MRYDLSCNAPLVAVLALFQAMATAAALWQRSFVISIRDLGACVDRQVG